MLFGGGERADSLKRQLRLDHEIVRHVWRNEDVNAPEFIAEMRVLEPNLFLVAGYPRIFGKQLLSVPQCGAWNCHGGPVPEYRGGSPLNWQIIDGKDVIGVTLMKMDEGLDTGPVIAEHWFHLGRNETIAAAHRIANTAFAMMVGNALANFPPSSKPQPASDAYRPQRTDADGMIDWSWDAKRIHDFVRALTHPYPGAWFPARNRTKVRLWSTSLERELPSNASSGDARSPASATAS